MTGWNPTIPVDADGMILEVHEVGGAERGDPHHYPGCRPQPHVGAVELSGVGLELDHTGPGGAGSAPEGRHLISADRFEPGSADRGGPEPSG